MPGRRILLVDDDAFIAIRYANQLRDAGYEVHLVEDADSALDAARSTAFDLAILDIMLPGGDSFGRFETHEGFTTGLALARELRKIRPQTKLLALTLSEDTEVVEWFTSNKSVGFASKVDTRPSKLPKLVRNLLEKRKARPDVFIVHGRDSGALSDLKAFLRLELSVVRPIVLREQPSKGMTLIEKFEHYANDVDLVFVLATADDIGYLDEIQAHQEPRARQNVIFEFGFFLGQLKRDSGRVILLHKGPLNLPSDIAGVAYIDLSGGFAAVKDELRRELADWR